jgi:hypothetical protein
LHLAVANPHIDTDLSATVYATEGISNRMFGSFVAVTAKSWSGASAHVIFHGTLEEERLKPSTSGVREPTKELVYWPGGGGMMERDKKPLRDYTIVGSWSGWEPQAMRAEGKGNFGHTVTLGEAGFERFQIWLDGKTDKVLHPNSSEGAKDGHVHGPVSQLECFGSCWQIDGRYKLQWQDAPSDLTQEETSRAPSTMTTFNAVEAAPRLRPKIAPSDARIGAIIG